MDLAEVVIGEVQRNRGPMAVNVLAERIRQSGKPANLHTHDEVLAFDMAGADLRFVGEIR